MCQVLVVQDPNLYVWNITATDDGLLVADRGSRSALRQNPIFNGGTGTIGFDDLGFDDQTFDESTSGGSAYYLLGISVDGNLNTTVISAPLPIAAVDYKSILSPLGFPFRVSVDFDGLLQTLYSAGDMVADTIPMPPNVTMSIYGTGDTLLCIVCGNEVVDARADLAIWCCGCQAFVLPEDTNLLTILDE